MNFSPTFCTNMCPLSRLLVDDNWWSSIVLKLNVCQNRSKIDSYNLLATCVFLTKHHVCETRELDNVQKNKKNVPIMPGTNLQFFFACAKIYQFQRKMCKILSILWKDSSHGINAINNLFDRLALKDWMC